MVSILRNKLLNEVVDLDNDEANRKVLHLHLAKTVSKDLAPLVKSDLDPQEMQKLSLCELLTDVPRAKNERR